MLLIEEAKYFTGANLYATISTFWIRFAADTSANLNEFEARFLQRLETAGFSIADTEARVADIKSNLSRSQKLFAATLAETLAHGVIINLRSTPEILGNVPDNNAIAVTTRNEADAKKAMALILDLFNATTDDGVRKLQKFIARLKKTAFRPMLGVILRSAEERGIPWMWGEHVGYHQIGHGCHRNWVDGTITGNLSVLGFEVSRRKSVTNRLLRSIAIPVPYSIPVANHKDAITAAKKIGYPVVVKPLIGHKGIGITVGVNGADQLAAAVGKAQGVNSWIIVEKFIQGGDVRLLVVGRKLVAAASRLPPRVTGNGGRTIEQLIYLENFEREKTPGIALPIEIDDDLINTLASQGYNLDTVLSENRVVNLRTVANWSQGGTSTDVTDIVHPDNVDMAVRAALAVGIDVAGVDFITPDISKPYYEIGGAICEVNYQPGLRVHLAADPEGKRDLGSPIIESMIVGDGRIDVIFVVDSGNILLASALAIHYSGAGKFAAVVDAYENPTNWQEQIETALRDPDCDALIVNVPSSAVVKRGAGIEYCRLIIRSATSDETSTKSISILEKICRSTHGPIIDYLESPWEIASRIADMLGLEKKSDKQAASPQEIASNASLTRIAKSRGVAVNKRIIWRDRALLQFGYGATQATYRAARTERTSFIATRIADDKQRTNRTLQMHGLPCTPQASVNSISTALLAVKKFGYPVIVKPSDSHESHGVTGSILNDDELANAIKKALNHSATALVEPFLLGKDHRFLVIDGRTAHVTRHETAHVVGNGTMTVEALIELANQDPIRGPNRSQPYTWLILNEDAKRMLVRQGLSEKSIPASKQVVILRSICSLSAGATAVDVTKIAHPDNLAAAEKAARVVGLDICGVDFLLPDVRKSYRYTGGAILEVNQRPAFDMHDASTNSTNRIRSIILNKMLNGKADHPIPLLHCIMGSTDAAESLARSLLPTVQSVLGLTGGIAVPDLEFAMVGSAFIASSGNSSAAICNSILADTRVQAAIFLTGVDCSAPIPENAKTLDFRSSKYSNSPKLIVDEIVLELSSNQQM